MERICEAIEIKKSPKRTFPF